MNCFTDLSLTASVKTPTLRILLRQEMLQLSPLSMGQSWNQLVCVLSQVSCQELIRADQIWKWEMDMYVTLYQPYKIYTQSNQNLLKQYNLYVDLSVSTLTFKSRSKSWKLEGQRLVEGILQNLKALIHTQCVRKANLCDFFVYLFVSNGTLAISSKYVPKS